MPGRMMPAVGACRGRYGAYTQAPASVPVFTRSKKQNRIAAFGKLPAEGSTFWRLSLGLVVRMDLTLLSCCVAQCTTLLWCWSLTSVQVRLSPLQGSRVLCRRSSLRWPNGRVLKVQCSQSLVYSGVLALFEVLGTTPNTTLDPRPERRSPPTTIPWTFAAKVGGVGGTMVPSNFKSLAGAGGAPESEVPVRLSSSALVRPSSA